MQGRSGARAQAHLLAPGSRSCSLQKCEEQGLLTRPRRPWSPVAASRADEGRLAKPSHFSSCLEIQDMSHQLKCSGPSDNPLHSASLHCNVDEML